MIIDDNIIKFTNEEKEILVKAKEILMNSTNKCWSNNKKNINKLGDIISDGSHILTMLLNEEY